MAIYAVGSVGPAQGSDAGEAIANLWNPDTEITLRMLYTGLHFQAAITGGVGSVVNLMRFSLQGTSPNVATPVAANAFDHRADPPSGATLRSGNFSVTPAVVSMEPIMRVFVGTVAGCNITRRFDRRTPLLVPPGTGVGWVLTGASTAVGTEFSWEE